MRFDRRRRPASVGMDMTPMIDVVFLLIIFFMTVSQASNIEYAAVQLPKLRGVVDQAERTLSVNITQDDTLLVSGAAIGLAEFDARVSRALAAAGGHPELVSVVLRVDRRSDSALVNRVLARLKEAGIRRTRIAVEVPGQG